MSALSSVMAIAGSGLLPSPPADVGASFVLPGNLTNAIGTYSNVGVIKQRQTICSSLANLAFVTANATISQSTLLSMLNLGANKFPAVTNTVPSTTTPTAVLFNGLASAWDSVVGYFPGDRVTYLGNTYISILASTNKLPTDLVYWNLDLTCYTFSSIVNLDATAVMGNNDLSKFCQVFMSADGYLSQANSTINSVRNSAILAETFSPTNGGMDNLTTGGLNQVSTNLQLLSADLLKLGQLINTSRLDYLGLPGELLAQIGRITNGILPGLSVPLASVGITDVQLRNLAKGRDELTARAQKIAFAVFEKITGNTLDQVKAILGVTTAGITNMAQLLDPVYILPKSYKTLVCPTGNGLVPIYKVAGTTVSANSALIPVINDAAVTAYAGPNFSNGYNTMKLITTPDQALANKALARSLQQVKNIAATSLPALGQAMSLIETNSNLPAIGNLTTPIPSSVGNAYQQQLGTGSGPGGTVLLVDVIGVVSQPIFYTTFANTTTTINSINTASLLSMYSYMGNTIAGDYYIPDPMDPEKIIIEIPSGPAQGTYATINQAFAGPGSPGLGLIPATYTVISNIANANPNSVSNTNSAWNTVITALGIQASNQIKAQINFGFQEANSTSATMSFTTNLHDYGVDVAPGGANEVLTKLAKISTLGGQCVISSLREGRNIEALQSAGIKLDTQLPDR